MALRLPPFTDPPEVLDEDEPVEVVRGRVVSATRAGVGGARVRLVSLSARVGASGPFVLGVARTSRSGRFRLVAPAYPCPPSPSPCTYSYRPGHGAPLWDHESLVAETDDVSRTVELHAPTNGRRRRLPAVIRLPRVEQVRVELRCSELSDEQRVGFPRVDVIWPRRSRRRTAADSSEEMWASRLLIPDGIDWPAPALPGRDLLEAGPVPPGAHRFAAEIALPRGQQVTLEATSPCGAGPCVWETRQVEIPDAGPVAPIVFDCSPPSRLRQPQRGLARDRRDRGLQRP